VKTMHEVACSSPYFDSIKKCIEGAVDKQQRGPWLNIMTNQRYLDALRAAGAELTATLLAVLGNNHRGWDSRGLPREEREKSALVLAHLVWALLGEEVFRCRGGPKGAAGGLTRQSIRGMPLTNLVALVTNNDARSAYLSSMGYPTDFCDRALSTDDCENIFSALVQKSNYKPPMELVIPILNNIDELAALQREGDRGFFMGKSSKVHYELLEVKEKELKEWLDGSGLDMSGARRQAEDARVRRLAERATEHHEATIRDVFALR
jgi:hypothetical protein